MSMLPKDAPAGEGGADPKGGTGASGTAGPPATTATGQSGQQGQSGSSGTTSSGTAPGTSGSPPSTGTPGATPAAGADPKATYEQKLASLADLEFSVKKQKDDIEARAGKLAALEKIADALPEGVTADLLVDALGHLKAGEEAAFLKKLLREKWTPEKLIAWADAFDAEELTVEQRVERKLAAEKKAEADAAAKKKADEEAADNERRRRADEQAVADAGKLLDEQTKGASAWLAANIAKYPLIQAMDDDEDVDHVADFRRGVIAYAEEHGSLPTDEEGLAAMRAGIFDRIEAKHRRQKDRLVPPPPKPQSMSEWDRTELVRIKGEEQKAVALPVKSGPLTGHEEALRRIREQDREDAERARLSYGR